MYLTPVANIVQVECTTK